MRCVRRGYVADGYEIVVDLDLEKFFDRVNHDILMSHLRGVLATNTCCTSCAAFCKRE
jgi:retron-type reverse transcriptase